MQWMPPPVFEISLMSTIASSKRRASNWQVSVWLDVKAICD
jgi:hypothetical protein